MPTRGQTTKSLPWRTKHKHIQAYGSESTNLTLPVMGLFETILAQAICAADQSPESDEITTTLTVHECLLNLLLRGHHEWTVLHNVLVKWLSRDLMSILHQPRGSSDQTNDPHQDEICATLQSVDGNARLLTVSRQNERVECIVCCARVANSNLPIHRCERSFSGSNRSKAIETYCR